MKQESQVSKVFAERLSESQGDLYAFVASLMPLCPDDVDDVVQEANLAMVSSAGRYDEARPFRPWMFRIAANKVKDFRRRTKSNRLVFDDKAVEKIAFELSKECGGDGEAHKTLLKRLAFCKTKLSEKHRRLVELRYTRKLTLPEIGKESGLTAQQCRDALAYIRAKLAACVLREECTLPDETLESSPDFTEVFDGGDLSEISDLKAYAGQAIVHHLLSRKWIKASVAKPRRIWPIALAASGIVCFAALASRTFFTSSTANRSGKETEMTKTNLLGKVAAAAAAIALQPLAAQAEVYTWTGAASSEWNATDANWDKGAWVDGNIAHFPSGVQATEITVSGTVQASHLTFGAGTWTFSGGTIVSTGVSGTGSGLFMDGNGDVSVTLRNVLLNMTTKNGYNNITELTLEDSTLDASSVERLHHGWAQGFGRAVINIKTGSIVKAKELPLSYNSDASKQDEHRINVLSGGQLQIKNLHSLAMSKYGSVYVDGGSIVNLNGDNAGCLFNGTQAWSAGGGNAVAVVAPNTKFSIGPGGFVFSGNSFRGGQPIYSGVTEDGEKDGGIVINKSGLVYLRSTSGKAEPINYFTGGVTFNQNATAIVSHDRNFGLVPEEAEANIVLNSSATILCEGDVELHPNRAISIAPGAVFKMSGNGKKFAIKGRIKGADEEAAVNGSVSTAASWTGDVSIEPEEGVTNSFGKLFVGNKTLTFAGEGVTEITSTHGSPEKTTETEAKPFTVVNTTLNVKSGLVRTTEDAQYAVNRGDIVVSGGTLDLSSNGEFLNSFRQTGSLTVKDGGTFICKRIRMSETDNNGNAVEGYIRLLDGGALLCDRLVMYPDNSAFKSKVTIEWDGGILATRTADADYNTYGANWLGHWQAASTYAENVNILVKEGGAVVSNDSEIRIRIPLKSGVVEGKDGGFTKWGKHTLAFIGTGMGQFTGPVRIMQGAIAQGSPDNFSSDAELYVASGANYRNITSGNSQTLAKLGGSGLVSSCDKLTVTGAIAPGMDEGDIGTLTISSNITSYEGCQLQIDVAEDGSCDRLVYKGDLDLSKLTLKATGTFNKKLRYTIISGAASLSGEFDSVDLPGAWKVRTNADAKTVELVPVNGTIVMLLGD